jgi:hypothetical protein
MSNAFDELMNVAADPAWRDQVLGTQAEMSVPNAEYIDPSIYAACFSTPAGRAVLADLHARYVNVSRFVPSEGAEAGYYREGMAQVVFEIAAMIEQSADDEATDAEQ